MLNNVNVMYIEDTLLDLKGTERGNARDLCFRSHPYIQSRRNQSTL